MDNVINLSRRLALLLLLSFAACAVQAQERVERGEPARVDDPNRYMQLVQWADEAVAKSNWPQALACLQEAMRTEPSNPQNVLLLSNMGMIHFYAGEDSIALRTLSEARAMAPRSVVILKNRARVLAAMQRPEDALSDYSLILEMDSTFADAYHDRASLLLQLDRYDEAATDAAHFTRLRPNDPHGKLLEALIASNTGHTERAIELYSDLIKAKPDAVLYSARAMCRLTTGDLARAADDIALGLELDANDPELYFARAYLNHLRFRDTDRDADLSRAATLGLAPDRIRLLPTLPR